MDFCDDVGLRDIEKVIVILYKLLDILKLSAPVVFFFQLVSLNLSAHRPVEHHQSG